MKLIWAFEFSKSRDPATKQYKVYDLNDFVKVSLYPVFRDLPSLLNQKIWQGILVGPNRFECEITPRSSHRAEVIRQELLGATQIFESFEQQLDSADQEFVAQLRRDLADGLHAL